MKNICEWENCREKGDYKAPIERDNSKNHRWLCKEHIKLFNKSWDYFHGMNQNEIEDFLKSDMTWHRPTQQFGSSENFFNILWNNALEDKYKFFTQGGKNFKYSKKTLIKAFQRRFRQKLVNGVIDQECFLISKNSLRDSNFFLYDRSLATFMPRRTASP